MKISIIGSGYVGLVSGTCFADLGINVICADNNKEKISSLKKGIVTMYEPSFMKIIQKKIKAEHLSSSVIYDAVASVVVDKGLSYIISEINTLIKKENKQVLKKRFSAGYGDFDLSNQKKIYDLLHLKDLGVKLSKNFLLTPEKSVTAVTGIVSL